VSTLRIVAPAMSCPASSAERAKPDQCRGHPANNRAVSELEVVAGRVEVVLLRHLPQPRCDEDGEYDGPQPADPTHHHAPSPSLYASPAAPTVEPAPMLAASIDARMRPGPRLRPATKNSLLPRTRREVQIPSPTMVKE
jgi:hypothetical protein